MRGVSWPASTTVQPWLLAASTANATGWSVARPVNTWLVAPPTSTAGPCCADHGDTPSVGTEQPGADPGA
ncbi:hypothetical protein CMMCAS03_04175 [Clavibacter michiganensis subsp. michiganensis]|nr:hypothetical protein CMMCAS03_04175 [Clavibacter michiganensis subsp. michiganensis]